MQFKTIIPALVLTTSTAYAAVAAPQELNTLEARQVPWRQCAHQTGGVHVIAAPGEGSTNPPYGLLSTLSSKILAAIPGSSNISLPYDHNQTNGLLQTSQGTDGLNAWIYLYRKTCPHSKIVLIGYSAGAIMTMNALCGESAPYDPARVPLDKGIYGNNVIAAVTYGDETYTPNESWNRGTCTASGGLHPRPNPAGCKNWTSKMVAYCDSDDPLCCTETGTDQANHYKYPARYDSQALQFVVDQFNKYGA